MVPCLFGACSDSLLNDVTPWMYVQHIIAKDIVESSGFAALSFTSYYLLAGAASTSKDTMAGRGKSESRILSAVALKAD